MPIVGMRCRWFDTTFDAPSCMTCAASGNNPCGYPYPLIKLMLRDRNPEEVSISSTMLGGCPREAGLKKHHDWCVDPELAYTRAFGSLVHEGAELLGQDNGYALTEQRYSRPLDLRDGRTARITAKLDVLLPESVNSVRIRDYKVVDTLSDSGINRKLAHHYIQFSVQRWILAGHGIEVLAVDLDFLHQKDRRNVNLYPIGEPELPNARLLSLEETEAYLQARVPVFLDSLDGDFAYPIDDPKEFWRCRRCDVREQCVQQFGGPIPALR